MKQEEKLTSLLQQYGKVALAYSGGIDSSFLLVKAKEILGRENVLAIIMDSLLIKQADTDLAIQLAKENDVAYHVLHLDELAEQQIAHYTMDSWYYSKQLMYREMKKLAKARGIEVIIDGMIMDDVSDIRPGLRARDELGVKSPLQEAGYYKTDIRAAAKYMPTLNWCQPSSCSVLSRFPVGTHLTKEKVQQVMASEAFLESLGFEQVRVRYHGVVARIEVEPSQLVELIQAADRISSYLQKQGFTYVTLDMTGYQSGKMNATLTETKEING